jgi:uncharacterized protein YkwD
VKQKSLFDRKKSRALNARKLHPTLGALLIFATTSLFCIGSSYSMDAVDLRSLEQQVYQKVNEARGKNQAPHLSWNEEVASEARRHAKNIVERRFFAHEDPKRGELSSRLDASGIDWNRCAENLYQENGFENPAEEAVQSWLKSPSHRKNMLDSGLAETGIGAAVGRDGTIYIVQIFIKRFIVVKTKSQ